MAVPSKRRDDQGQQVLTNTLAFEGGAYGQDHYFARTGVAEAVANKLVIRAADKAN